MLMADDYDNITYPLTELGWELGGGNQPRDVYYPGMGKV